MMHVKRENLMPITKDEIIFIRSLAQKEFKSTDLCENLQLKSKIYDVCYKLRVCSFEEVLRKVLFYKLFEVELSEQYLQHVQAFSREKISTLCTLRNTLIDAGKNVSDEFADFCNITVLWEDAEFQEKINTCIEQIKSNVESHRMFNSIQSFINLVNVKHDFDQMFNIVFDLDDFEFQADAEKVAETFSSLAVKYIFIVRILMGFSFPLNIKREITQEEKDIIRFLLYKGDEIDYMQQYNVSPLIFNDKLNSIITAYDAENLQEMLLKANMELTLNDSSLIFECINYHIRTSFYLKKPEKTLELTPENRKDDIKRILENLEEIRNENFLPNTTLFDKYLEKAKELKDHYYLINGKIESIKGWFCENIMPIENIRQMRFLLAELESLVPYESIWQGYEEL